MTDIDKKAYVEIRELLKHVRPEEVQRIPQEELDFFDKNKDPNYKFKFDDSKNISEQDVLPQTREVFVNLYNKYVK